MTVESLSAEGYSTSGKVEVDTYACYGTNNVFDVASPTAHSGRKGYQVKDGAFTIDITQESNHTAWAFEFGVKK